MRGPSFAAVLDEALSRAVSEPFGVAARARTSQPGPHVISPFLFARPLTSPAPRWATPANRLPRRPAHLLTAEQRTAFEQLVALGADLSAGFTADELQREYHRLARRYHPDRHGACGPLERQQLSRTFADAAESHRCLRPVVEPTH